MKFNNPRQPINNRLLAFGVLLVLFLLMGCNQLKSMESDKTARAASSSDEQKSDKSRFGPVYPVLAISDPVIAQAVRSAQTTGAPVVRAEIRGYLVNWVIKETSSSTTIREFVVMKDGSLYRDNEKRPRPYGAFSKGAPPRLTPESKREAQSRKAALAAAHLTITKIAPTFASAEPAVYFYIVRIHRKDGSSADILRGREIELSRVKNH